MNLNSIQSLAKNFTGIVQAIEDIEIVEKEAVRKLKCSLRLFDGTMLKVREIWLQDKMLAYSYYWLRSDESLIIGWDNAPHHKSISTFPDHKHVGKHTEFSYETDLGQVLSYIQNFYYNSLK